MEQRQTYKPQEVAKQLGCGRDAVYTAIRLKRIKYIRLGRKILIARNELERILREGLE